MSKKLIKALKLKHYDEALRQLVSGSFDVNATDKTGQTALHIVGFQGNWQMVDLLIKLGFDVNAKDSAGCTPLHLSSQYFSHTHALITKSLLKARSLVDARAFDQQTPLHKAVQAQAYPQVRLLVQAQAGTALLDHMGQSPLDYATNLGFNRIQTFLIRAYDDPNASDTDSEDEMDYQYNDEYEMHNPQKSKSSMSKKDRIFSATVNFESIFFKEEWIIPNGDCAFIGLGTDRETLTRVLRGESHVKEVRESIWEEIAEALLMGDFSPKGASEVLQVFYGNRNQNANLLKDFCSDEQVFNQYMDLLEDDEQKVWLGYHTAFAFAKIQSFNVFLWTQGDGQNLDLYRSMVVEAPVQEIHLHYTGGFTHFNLLVKKQGLKEELDGLDEKMKSLSLKESMPNTEKPTPVIAHYRGIHYYPEHYTREQRKQSKTIHRLQAKGELPRLGLYSGATHEKAKEPLAFPNMQGEQDLALFIKALEQRELHLQQANKAVTQSMQQLQKTGQVDYCLGVSSSGSRETYDSRYLEYIQRYVNSYKTLMEDMGIAATKKIDGRQSDRTKEKWKNLKGLGFSKLPLVSTSEAPEWGLEYATALLNWDPKTHQPRIGKVAVLSPSYQPDGHPRFPYLGVLYVSFHTQEGLGTSCSTRILDLFTQNTIDTKCASPGGHVTGGYIKARERAFIGGIAAEHIIMELVIRAPSFYAPYRDFIQTKYGMSERLYNDFKNKLSTYGHPSPQGGMRNSNAFHNTQHEILKFIIDFQQKDIEIKIKREAERNGLSLFYLDVDSKDLLASLPELTVFTEKKSNSKRI